MSTTINSAGQKQAAPAATAGATPKDAAAVILLRAGREASETEVFWVRRSTRMAFLG
ncbi:MAG: hypothetical protein ICV68_05390, partial [Pyrinomonadaceae bacterium]|nr:hypothetical protein [Pyrinomonadaceae bacterium]